MRSTIQKFNIFAYLLYITSIFAFTTELAFGQSPDNQAYVIKENALPSRTPIVTYRKADQALQNIPDSSANFVNLTQKAWGVKFFQSPELAHNYAQSLKEVADINSAHIDTLTQSGAMTMDQISAMRRNQAALSDSTTLPLSWNLNGIGMAVWSPRQGLLSPESVVAVYDRSFNVPFDYIDKNVFIRINGGSSKITLYINGAKVGFYTDSRTCAEYNITPYIERGVNRISVVDQGSTLASRLETQADWRLQGINRDIDLLVQPKIRIYDYINTTSLDPTYTNGLLQAALLLKTELLNTHMVTISYELIDPHGNLVNKEARDVRVGMREVDTVRFLSSIPNVKSWSADSPNLYTIVYGIKREGRWIEYSSVKVGFRQIEIRGEHIIFNGQRLIFKGVTFPEFSNTSGNYMPRHELAASLLKVKSDGYNAIYTGGYPMPYDFYELTDSIGFYVVDCANVSSQHQPRSTSLVNDPAWRDAIVDRAVSMYEQGKNNPSIIIWNLGDDSGNGYCMYESYLKLKSLDKTRPVAYCGANGEWNTDIDLLLGASPAKLRDSRATQRPMLSIGAEFDPKFWESDLFQGAILGRYTDADLHPDSKSVKFAELTRYQTLSPLSDARVNVNIAPSSVPLFQNLEAKLESTKPIIINITNHMQYRSDFRVSYTVIRKGKTIAVGTTNINIRPNHSAPLTVPQISKLPKKSTIQIDINNGLYTKTLHY